MKTSFGIIYVATGASYIEEAAFSARSAKKHMPDVPVAIATDDEAAAKKEDIFDSILDLGDGMQDYGIKIRGMQMSPFERTIFLDTDTRVLAPFYELFPILDKFDLAMAHDPPRVSRPVPSCPESFPEPNTGVVAYRSCEAIDRLFDRWRQVHAENKEKQTGGGGVPDQDPLRQVLWEEGGDFRQYVLAPEYNLRCHCPWFACGEVKIIHGRGPCQDRTARIANRTAQMRVGDGLPPLARLWFDLKDVIKSILPVSPNRSRVVTAEKFHSFSYQLQSLEEAEHHSKTGELQKK